MIFQCPLGTREVQQPWNQPGKLSQINFVSISTGNEVNRERKEKPKCWVKKQTAVYTILRMVKNEKNIPMEQEQSGIYFSKG